MIFKRLRTATLKHNNIEFLCYKQDYGVIAEPVPARKILPQWFKDLPPKIDRKDKIENSTIKRCMPVLDALTAGWIITLAADVEFITNGDATGVQTKSNFYRQMIDVHTNEQVAGHPELPKPPFKWRNYWAIKLPLGYSMLFMPPLNRYEPRFECFSGIVDDTYMGQGALEFINFPFFFKQTNYTGIIRKGTPLVQCIPIKRESIDHKVDILSQTDEELIEHTRRRRSTHDSMYRDELRQPK
jgi:hypothetical protein